MQRSTGYINISCRSLLKDHIGIVVVKLQLLGFKGCFLQQIVVFKNQMAYVKGYTAKVYGIEGAKYRGFDVDYMFPAGSNAGVNDYQANTMGLLRFHTHRALLSGLLEVTGWYENLSGDTKQLIDTTLKAESPYAVSKPLWKMVTRGLIFPIVAPFNMIKYWPNSFSHLKNENRLTLPMFSKTFQGVRLPNSVATVLTYQPRIAPPLPDKPTEVLLADNTVIIPDPMKIEEWTKKELLEKKRQVSYEEQEVGRLINDATKFIVWSSQIAINEITIYEKTGRLSQNIERLAKAVHTKFAKLGLKYSGSVGIFTASENYENKSNNEEKKENYWANDETIHVASLHEDENENQKFSQKFSTTKKSTGKLMIINQNGVSKLYQTDDNSPGKDFVGLRVIILSQNHDLKYSLVNGIRELMCEIKDKAIDCKDLNDCLISNHISSYLIGVPIKLDLFILFGKAESTDGFPVYALKNTLIVRPTSHADWTSPQLGEFARALEIWGFWNEQDTVDDQ